MDNWLFLELIQVSIGNRKELSVTPSEEEWLFIYDLSRKHSLLGITFAGIERLEQNQRPSRMLLLQWAGACKLIIEKNKIITDKCSQISKWFECKGFENCILKGQGNNFNYPEWLKNKRTPGDLDIWVWLKDFTNNVVKKVVNACNVYTKITNVRYHHFEFSVLDSAEVEVHFRPSWLSSPIINFRLQEWFKSEKESIKHYNEERKGAFPIPTPKFNIIFQLIHIYRHLFVEGIGLRQIIDYYFVLENYHNAQSEDIENLIIQLKRFKLFSFAGAMMYVLRNALNMPEDYMICEPDEKRGKHLLNEILIAGNFGWYDDRIKWFNGKKALVGLNSLLMDAHNFFKIFVRNLKMLKLYPNEVLWNPYSKIYLWFWRKLKLWRL